MHQHHDHGPQQLNRAFAIGVALNISFVAIEAGFGFWANSLALLADAGHNLSDVIGLLLAWGASYLASHQPSQRRTYGLKRSSILAALLNAVLLLLAVGAIVWEALQRFGTPEEVSAWVVVGVAAAGVVINTATALLFMSGREHDLNVRGAYLHMAADAVISAGVVAAGLVIRATGWTWIDPLSSIVIAVIIAYATWGLLRESLDLALDAVPAGIDPAEVEAYLAGIPGIASVHHLHVWGMSTTEIALTVHLTKPDGKLDDALLERITAELHDRFRIEHSTIQLEQGNGAPGKLLQLTAAPLPTHDHSGCDDHDH
jgi:cobalt-zinc-cadmium efflux system protein